MIYALGDQRIETDGEFFVADSAIVIGTVRLRANSSIWFNCVLRGDSDWIEIGEDSNVQDASIVHCDAGTPTIVGSRVTVGHRVLLHGCTIAAESLIGNGAIVLNGAKIGSGSIVAAGSLVPPRMVVPDGVVVMGSLAEIVRESSERDREAIAHGANHYVKNAARFRSLLRRDERFT